MATPKNSTHDSVKDYYGKVLSSSSDLRTPACTTGKRPCLTVRGALAKVPQEVSDKYYGCGVPLPLGIEGLRVLDLGSGSGRDCYAAAVLVGPTGMVTGIDMTDEQLDVARRHADAFCTETLGYPSTNLKFVKGYIEYLDQAGIEDNSMDLIISNCVVNLSPDKARILREAYRVLAPGGEMYFSDIYCDRRLPEHLFQHEVLLGECISGALYVQDFLRLAKAAGFADPRVESQSSFDVSDPELLELLGEARFFSITYRLFKIPDRLETECEDYGQIAWYKGTIPGHKNAYQLDQEHRFEVGRKLPVCGNSASMLEETWLRDHFEVLGDRSVHYGLFDCKSSSPRVATSDSNAAGGGCC